ncbi:hypothetical protein [Urbifossiella limnaea]|uniref:hypothetical protein n=1 Tax=Urbifossiella limnaea TaxID=2528023 RepID=UPI00119FF211|nr:hypothetical protein [Urbifossiella limnaea]
MPDPLPRPAARAADAVSTTLVLVVAALAASFVARNSDVWLHLAAGRLIATGDYTFGADPFAAPAGKSWANHAWLFDLGLYLAFTHLGPAAVVALKAAAVASTAALMLAVGRGPRWLAAGCVLLAVAAMAPRLQLHPMAASVLLLAACLWCLVRGGTALRAVPVLVAVWVNVDGWFLLGPLLVGLFALGRRLDRTRPEPWPRWLVPATLAACLLSPHHVRALALPPELSPAAWAEFADDPRLAPSFASPWSADAFRGYNFAALAFVALLALGVVSFLLNRPALRGWRGPVWLVFAALAAWQARLIPFFAVVAGPVTALNFGEAFPTAWPRLGRIVVLLAGVALAGLGWFGKLTGFHVRDRGAAWGVHADPTLEHAAGRLAEWRATGVLPADAVVFTSHPDVGHYLAWFAPGERSSIDARLALFAGDDYRERSEAVGLLPGRADPQALLSRGSVAALVYDPDPQRLTAALRAAAARWDVARVAGGAVLVVPKGAAPRFDPERAAFGPSPEAAGVGPDSLAEPAPWWDVTRGTGRRGSWHADAGTIYLRLVGEADRSPALPLLAMRAGRLGAERDPADGVAWLVAARAALALDARTWERDAGEPLTPLAFVRHAAAAGALVQAVRRNPDSAPAQEALAGVYGRRGFVDLAHKHAAAALRLPGHADGVAAVAEQAEKLVHDAENRFLVRTVGLTGDPLARARAAAGLGLPQRAVDVLLASHPDLYGVEGLSLLADLLIQTGQLPEARVLLDRSELRDAGSLGLFTLPGRGGAWVYRFPARDWYDFCQCAAAGHYPGAFAAVERIGARLDAEERQVMPAVARALSAQAGRLTALAAAWGGPAGVGWVPVVGAAGRDGQRVAAFAAEVRFLTAARADLGVLAGVLELERGNPTGAAGRFRAALALYAPDAPRPGEALARRYLEALGR